MIKNNKFTAVFQVLVFFSEVWFVYFYIKFFVLNSLMIFWSLCNDYFEFPVGVDFKYFDDVMFGVFFKTVFFLGYM